MLYKIGVVTRLNPKYIFNISVSVADANFLAKILGHDISIALNNAII